MIYTPKAIKKHIIKAFLIEALLNKTAIDVTQPSYFTRITGANNILYTIYQCLELEDFVNFSSSSHEFNIGHLAYIIMDTIYHYHL